MGNRPESTDPDAERRPHLEPPHETTHPRTISRPNPRWTGFSNAYV